MSAVDMLKKGAGEAATTTIGRLIFNDIIPKDVLDLTIGEDGDVDSKSVKSVLTQIAHRYPDRYKDISHQLLRLGVKGSTETNTSFGLDDLESPVNKAEIFGLVDKEIDGIMNDPKLTAEEKERRKLKVYDDWGHKMPNLVFNEAMRRGSGLAKMVASGARGNRSQLSSNIGADFAVSDQTGRQIPIPILNNYSEGLNPAEYFATAYGTRLGLISTKFCVTASTSVRMADGSKREISHIRPGEWVAGADASGVVIPVRVVRVFQNGKRICKRHRFRIHSSSSFVELEATDEHKVLAKFRYWGKAKHQSINLPTKIELDRARNDSARNYVAVPAQTGVEVTGSNEPYAFLIGWMLGDGHVARHSQITISCADTTLLEETEEYLWSLNFTLKKASPNREVDYGYHLNFVERPEKELVTGPRVGFGGSRVRTGCPFRKKIYDWGWVGRLAPEKTVPDEAFSWDNDSVAELLAGIYSADGTICRQAQKSVVVSITLTSRKMLEQIRELLWCRFGIYSSEISPVDCSKKKWVNHDQWQLKFSHRSSVTKFLEQIPLRGKKRQKALEMLQFFRDNPSQREDNVFVWSGSELIGEAETYDLEVDHPDHLYVLANGLIVSNSVQAGGYFSKLLSAAAGDILVQEDDCETPNGLPVPLDDYSNIGAVLARNVGPVKAGTVLTPKVVKQIKGAGHTGKILVRSPITCATKGGGICAHCAGIREKGRFPSIGDNVGLSASSGLAEPVTQSLLSLKHSAGVASAGGAGKVLGFPQIEALAQIPKNYPYAATLSLIDGKVEVVEDAPQGGTYVTVSGEKHYVPEGRPVFVKPGTIVEAGDALSEGVPNPAEVVRHKGIGAGRAYFVDALQKALKENGTSADRRNVEVMSRALINHVRIGDKDPDDDHLPDDIIEYSAYVESYRPDKATKIISPSRATGQYLQRPALHFSIGTRITPSVIKTLDEMGEKEIEVSPNKPNFDPEMIRVMDNPSFKPDFMVHTGQSYVKRNLSSDVASGKAESSFKGQYWQPALARATDFGVKLEEEGAY